MGELLNKLVDEQKFLVDESEKLMVVSKTAQRAVQSSLNKLELVEKEISAIENNKGKAKNIIEVSDHALVRYLSRVLNINVDEMKEKIINDIGPMATIGNGKFPVGNGCRAVVVGKAVVSIF